MAKDMVFTPVARSLISANEPVTTDGASLRQVEGFGTLNLRLKDEASYKAAAKALGVDIPTKANTFAGDETCLVLWLGPNEWMVQVPDEKIGDLHSKLEKALSKHHVAVTIVSDHSVAMEVSGPDARVILEKGCPLDLHPRAFSTGHCAQSHFLQAVIIIAQLDDAPRYLIRIRRSMSEYLWEALSEAIARQS